MIIFKHEGDYRGVFNLKLQLHQMKWGVLLPRTCRNYPNDRYLRRVQTTTVICQSYCDNLTRKLLIIILSFSGQLSVLDSHADDRVA